MSHQRSGDRRRPFVKGKGKKRIFDFNRSKNKGKGGVDQTNFIQKEEKKCRARFFTPTIFGLVVSSFFLICFDIRSGVLTSSPFGNDGNFF
jgi:hypothetical protein